MYLSSCRAAVCQEEERLDSSFTPTTLYRVQVDLAAPPVYLLGSIHTKPHETYPVVVSQVIKKTSEEKGRLFTEINFKKDEEDMENFLKEVSMKEWVDHLRASAKMHSNETLTKDSRLIEQCEQSYITWMTKQADIEPQMKRLLERHIPHPFFVSYYLKLEKDSPIDEEKKGIDHYASHLFPPEYQEGLETEKDRVSFAKDNKSHLENFLLFEMDVADCLKHFEESASEKENSDTGTKRASEAQHAYEHVLSYPLYDFEGKQTHNMKERNHLWRSKLDEFLSTPLQQSLLILVGAYHLGGATGLLSYFSEKGMPIYRVYQDEKEKSLEKEFIVDPALFPVSRV